MANEMVDAAGDARTTNNTMRHQYRTLTDAEKAQMTAVKDAGEALRLAISDINVSTIGAQRETGIALERTEEAVMWAVKGLTK